MRIAVAYSGGLDTSAALAWLKKERRPEALVAVLVDVGQGEDLDALAARAKALGATETIVADKREAFAAQGVFPALRAGATYENGYLLGTALARPFIAQALIEAMLAHGCTHACHGATSRGNDYLRLETAIRTHFPQAAILSPWREWGFQGREDLLALLAETGVIFEHGGFSYSVDANLWHTSYEGGALEDLRCPLPLSLQEAMSGDGQSVEVEIGFEEGFPVTLDGAILAPAALVSALNAKLATSGYGWIDIVETRTNGLKSRGVYHTPGGTLLHHARSALDACSFAGPTLAWMKRCSEDYGRLVYEGHTDHPLVRALDASFASLYEGTRGTVALRVHNGRAHVLWREAKPNRFRAWLGGFGRMGEWNAQWGEALVPLQRLRWHALPFSESALAGNSNASGGAS